MSSALVVVERPENWPLDLPGVQVVAARSYLSDAEYGFGARARVFNLCRSYRYQRLGYYVSLLATARGHKPIPDVSTIQDLKEVNIIRTISDDLDALIQKSLSPIKSDKFVLSIYFGRNVARRYDRLSSSLFKLFQAPLLRAHFVKRERWEVQNINLISISEVPEEHRPFVVEFAQEYLGGKRFRGMPRREVRFDLAILRDSVAETNPASDDRAIKYFIRAANGLDLDVEVIGRGDYGRLAAFDALFIRDTTNVNHYTYRFARRAVAEGLIVIDHPESILKCNNKVYLAELLNRHKVRTPKTVVVGRDNSNEILPALGLPCILKQPDSSFSMGVSKVETEEELESETRKLLERSELIVAQEFLPTDFDWRIGILDGRPLYACKYFMARRHWQIIKNVEGGNNVAGKVETVPVEEAPQEVVRTALRAANLIGQDLYGVDVKYVNKKSYVIEINDNPSIDAGYEDTVLKQELYQAIIASLVRRIEEKKIPRSETTETRKQGGATS